MIDVECLMFDFGHSIGLFNEEITPTICPVLKI